MKQDNTGPDPELTRAHEAIFAEFNDYKTSRDHSPKALHKHMARIRQLTDAKIRTLNRC